jgi:hypothetical protein
MGQSQIVRTVIHVVTAKVVKVQKIGGRRRGRHAYPVVRLESVSTKPLPLSPSFVDGMVKYVIYEENINGSFSILGPTPQINRKKCKKQRDVVLKFEIAPSKSLLFSQGK